MFINGGAGVDTIVVVGTPIGDIFVVTDAYVAGAGRLVTFTNVEAVEVDGAGGDDTIYVLSTGTSFETIVDRRLGDDTIHVGGDAADAGLRPAAVRVHAAAVPRLAAAGAGLRHDPAHLDNFTFRVSLGEWLARGGQLIPNGRRATRSPRPPAWPCCRASSTAWAQSLGFLGSSVLLELIEVGGITARPRWNFFFSFLFGTGKVEVTVARR